MSVLFFGSLCKLNEIRQALSLRRIVYNYASIWNNSCLTQCHIPVGAIHRCLQMTFHKLSLCLCHLFQSRLAWTFQAGIWIRSGPVASLLQSSSFIRCSGYVLCIIVFATLTSADCSERCQEMLENMFYFCSCKRHYSRFRPSDHYVKHKKCC